MHSLLLIDCLVHYIRNLMGLGYISHYHYGFFWSRKNASHYESPSQRNIELRMQHCFLKLAKTCHMCFYMM
jgi:hypothetical protein